tara:strand:+ start:4889 stop:5287 length:399 start_codon:yes stop_codon:yes gene_type:complete
MIFILVADFEPRITKPLECSAKKVLDSAQANYETFHVPGAVELPILAQRLIRERAPQAIIAIGCVIQGETEHFRYVLRACTDGLTRVCLDGSVPIIQGILACPNFQTAWNRRNLGKNYASTALRMIKILKDV